MKSNKGVTTVELLLSVILISLVLIFIIQLCLRARNSYLNNNNNVKYELSKSIIIDNVMDDYIKKGIDSITNTSNSISFNFSDNSTKTLSIIEVGDSYVVKYEGASDKVIGRAYLKSDINNAYITVTTELQGDNKLSICEIRLDGADGQDYSIKLYLLGV